MIGSVELVAAERRRQIEEENYDAAHDGQHDTGALLGAAFCYCIAVRNKLWASPTAPTVWPRGWKWKPRSPLRMLVIAAALLCAEIDRRLSAGERV